MRLYERIYLRWLELAQWIYGRDRLGWDEACDGSRPVDARSRVAGWLLLRRNFWHVS